jgi:hypothetical protein
MPDASVDYRPHCAVAFLDVLGWRRLVERSVSDGALRQKLAIALTEAGRQRVSAGTPIRSLGSLPVIRQFSDSVVIAVDISAGEPWSLESFLGWVDRLCKLLLDDGLFLRGGMAFGRLFHQSNAVFGPALVTAYDLESKRAKSPRVIAGSRDEPHALPVPDDFPDNPLKTDSGDGCQFLDALRIRHPDPATARREQCNLLDRVRPHVLTNLQAHAGDWPVLEKFRWFARYFNELAKEFGVEEIVIPDHLAAQREHLRRELAKANEHVVALRKKLKRLSGEKAP